MENKKCYHESMLSQADEFGEPLDICICEECNVKREDAFTNPSDIDPFTRVSQQPHHDKFTLHCNRCDMYVEPDLFDGEEHCPHHQYVRHNEEGSFLQYDEFDQDGN
jgi:hypothetical protein